MSIIKKTLTDYDKGYIAITDIIYYLQYIDGEVVTYSEIARYLLNSNFIEVTTNEIYILSENGIYSRLEIIYNEEGDPKNILNLRLTDEGLEVPKNPIFSEIKDCLNKIVKFNTLYDFNLYIDSFVFEMWLPSKVYQKSISISEFFNIKKDNPEKYKLNIHNANLSFNSELINDLTKQIEDLKQELEQLKSDEQVLNNLTVLSDEDLKEYHLIKNHKSKSKVFKALLETLQTSEEKGDFKIPLSDTKKKTIQTTFTEKCLENGVEVTGRRAEEAARILT